MCEIGDEVSGGSITRGDTWPSGELCVVLLLDVKGREGVGSRWQGGGVGCSLVGSIVTVYARVCLDLLEVGVETTCGAVKELVAKV